jgi:uncharacterized protein YqfA (UPF0365 family)
MVPYQILIFLAAGTVFLFIFLYFVPVNLWITAIFSGVRIEIFELVFMRIRRVPPGLIVKNLIHLSKAGINVSTAELETHHLAGGNLDKVTRGMIAAKNSGQELAWQEATKLDLSGQDIEYHLKKKMLETEGGIDQLRGQLSAAILHDLDADEIREVARVMERMKPFK